jgi:TIGR03009 family protein
VRTLMTWTMTLTVGSWAAGVVSGQAPAPAQKRAPAPAPAAKAVAPAPLDANALKAKQQEDERALQEMNQLLDAWEAQSKKVTSIDVAFERIDKLGAAWGDVYYQGRAMLKSPDLACLEFTKCKLDDNGKPIYKRDKNGKPLQPLERELEPDPNERIVCTGKEVLQYQWDEKVVYVFPLEKEVRQKALQQGPLPFLFNMRADDAKKRYGMRVLQQDDKEYLISIAPREEIDKQSFSKAFLWLNKKTFLPNKLWLFPIGGKELQEFRFTGIMANKPMDNGFFSPNLKIAGWKVIFNPNNDGNNKPAQAPGANAGPQVGQAQPARPAPRPAMRPGTNPR